MLAERQPIPVRSAEEIAADTERRRGDDEKVVTTPIKELVVCGVQLQSRYGKADEYELMQSAILAMGPLAGLLKTLFCNSKAMSYFGVLQSWDAGTARVALHAMEAAILQHGFGHSGITLAADDGTPFGDAERRVEADPKWRDVFE